MRQIPALSLRIDRFGDILPFLAAALLFATIVMQAKILPFKQKAVEFPPAVDMVTTPGALPQYAVLSDEPDERDRVQIGTLPTEAVPTEEAPASLPPSAVLAPSDLAGALGATAAAPGFAAGFASPSLAAPAGAGNLHIRTSRSLALSVLATNLMMQIRQLHPVRPPLPAKRPPSPAIQRPAASRASVPAQPGAARPAASGLGGPAPPAGMLGGPASLASRYAPVIDGTALRRRF